MGTSKYYCLWYRSHWCPEVATVDTQWFWEDTYSTWGIVTSKIINVQTWNVLLWSLMWTLQNLQETETQKTYFRWPVFIHYFFLLYFDVDSPSVDLALYLFVPIMYCILWQWLNVYFNCQRDGRRDICSVTLFNSKVILSMWSVFLSNLGFNF